MNIPVQYSRGEFGKELHYLHYSEGHCDARHAAAELSLKAEARIEELEEILKAFVNWRTNEEGTMSLVDDEELWKRAEEVLNK
jgi:hypothetical protein